MKFLNTIAVCIIGLTASVTASISSPSTANVIPIDNTQFEISAMWEDFVNTHFEQDDLNMIYEMFEDNNGGSGLQKRDYETTVESILNLVNNSGIIWTVLDEVAGHPERIQFLANLTGNLLSYVNVSSLNFGSLLSVATDVNATGLIKAVEQSGLISSLLDGILLDDSFRPVLVNIIYRVVKSQENTLLFIIDGVFQKRDLNALEISDEEFAALVKRASDDYAGTLLDFAGNIASKVLSSNLFVNLTGEVLDALNETQFLTYTVKRFLADEAYQNMTALLIKDIISSGDIKISLSSLNITALVSAAVSKPQLVATFIGGLLSGNVPSSVTSSLGKYAGAVKQIILDLQNTGLFQQLNSYIFGSTTTTSGATTTQGSNNNKEAAITSSTLSTVLSTSAAQTSTPATTSSKAAGESLNSASETNIPIIKALFYIQSLVFGGALFMI
ncbi:hypothetical protein DFJ63DRAFT_211640 [Scheffersomyces coipomensis]|uniref:uncharacterized protein n=1 Tax=Scheffersomyces coipomensis TaxID=1788519 RepID=UPI00315D4CD6